MVFNFGFSFVFCSQGNAYHMKSISLYLIFMLQSFHVSHVQTFQISNIFMISYYSETLIFQSWILCPPPSPHDPS
jgi:hypothetical protein